MLVVFCVWSLMTVFFVVMGVSALFAKKAVPFWTVDWDIDRKFEVDDWRAYNKKLAILYFVYAGVFGVLGLPFLFEGQGAIAFIVAILGVPIASISMMVVYALCIEPKHRR